MNVARSSRAASCLWSGEIADEEDVVIEYGPPGRPIEPRRILPLSLYDAAPHTYLVAYSYARKGQRTFRLDRILGVSTVEEA